ncbi:MAG: amidohydrolase family protein, partial [Angelakisella sp.]
TSASYNQGVAAIEAGAISCTHFGHRMSTITPLSPTVTSALLESDGYCEVICDPDLLHPALLRLLLKVKGLHRMVAETNSLTTPSQMLRYIVDATELPLPKAITLLTENPAKLLGIYHAKGSLDVGKDADFTVLDDSYNVLATFSGGEMIFGQ